MSKKYFGVMMDMSRNAVMKPEQVVEYAKILKSFGYNMIQLYTEDTYEVDGEPYFGYMRGGYTQAELKFIVDECEKLGVEVVPCIQTLAHLNQMFRWGVYGGINDTADILLVDEPRAYELIENMFKSIRKCFRTEYVHIGMDEAHMVGLGKYLDKHGFTNRFELLAKHLKRVIEIAEKYGFKTMMWSDMFFRLANQGEYVPVETEPQVPKELLEITPKNVGLVYWDYYHHEKKVYDKMFAAHKKFDNELWFAGGAWKWVGFAPGNKKTLETMIPAMRSAKENGVDNILMTMWGDDGGECSFYAVLPSLYAVKRIYDGEEDTDKIKAEFNAITGENYDAMFELDCPNYVAGNETCLGNVCKHKLYSDPFNGFLDSVNADGVSAEYAAYAKKLAEYAKESKYAYLFESAAALCETLELKYDLGARTRKAYQAGDKAALKTLVNDYATVEERVETFYLKFREQWYRENKTCGFDVQDQRFGGLLWRLKSCRERLAAYLAGEVDRIAELEEKLLDIYGGGETLNKKQPTFNGWAANVSANKI